MRVMIVPPNMTTKPKAGVSAKAAPKLLTEAEIDALIVRVEHAIDTGAEVSSADLRLLLEALKWVMHVSERLAANDLTIYKLKKLLGIVSASEKSKDLTRSRDKAGAARSSEAGTDKPTLPHRGRPHGKPKASEFTSAAVEHHKHPDLGKGSICPDCGQGKLYKFEPAQFVRVEGHAPLTATLHISERLRCNLCQQTYKAPLPQAVLADGAESRRFGYSATAAIALLRYGAGMPHYRQHSLQKMLGVPVSTSTLWDLSEALANAAHPVYGLLQQLASTAWLFYSDDTRNRILHQEPVTRQKRRSKKEIERSGINTSGLAAALDDGRLVVLYKTGINHAGEALDEILRLRPPDLPAFLHMSDGLTSNVPTVRQGQELDCNAHARREFTDLSERFPGEVDFVLDTYREIYRNERQTAAMTPAERLAYHQKHSLPLMEALIFWGEQALEQRFVEPNSPLGGAIHYMLKRKPGLLAFCTSEGAPIDNNLLERKLKMVVLHRKNSLFYKEPLGAKVGDILMSLIATANEAQVNVFDYLVALQRHADDVKKNPSSYLPWTFARTVSDKANMQ